MDLKLTMPAMPAMPTIPTIDKLPTIITPTPSTLAGNHIARFYPMWRQLNIMRVGTVAQKKTMDMFIVTVQAWSNTKTPKESKLALLKPV